MRFSYRKSPSQPFRSTFFFENNCGAKPPTTNILIKGENQKLTKSLKRGRGKKAPNQ
jgi:hypothetical protein